MIESHKSLCKLEEEKKMKYFIVEPKKNNKLTEYENKKSLLGCMKKKKFLEINIGKIVQLKGSRNWDGCCIMIPIGESQYSIELYDYTG